MSKQYYLSAVTMLLVVFCFAQSPAAFQDEIKFADYLILNKQYADADYILKKCLQEKNQPDSLHYFLGWNYYHWKKLDSSVAYFKKITPASPFFLKAKFYSAFSLAYVRKTADAVSLLRDSSLFTPEVKKLSTLELAGTALLDRDYAAYKKYSSAFSNDYYAISEQQKNLADYYRQLTKMPKRSGLLAGVLSAIIPGSGKMYAGFPGQGIAAFLQVGILGAVTAENYIKSGPKNIQTIVFGSLFTVFYVGDIWSSVLHVKIKRKNRIKKIDDAILYDMHAPLGDVFK